MKRVAFGIFLVTILFFASYFIKEVSGCCVNDDCAVVCEYSPSGDPIPNCTYTCDGESGVSCYGSDVFVPLLVLVEIHYLRIVKPGWMEYMCELLSNSVLYDKYLRYGGEELWRWDVWEYHGWSGL
jgi:hypothetical protein